MSKIIKLTYKIRIDEVDNRHFLTVPNLAKYLQEVAWEASILRQNSVNDLQEQGLTWVLSRLQVQMDKYPKYADEITFETWGASFDKYFVYRNFRIFDSTDTLIGKATSSWLIVNIEQGKMIPMPQEVVEAFIVDNGEMIPMNKTKIPNISEATNEYKTQVRWSDLDINQHSNNTHYYRWAMDSLPIHILAQKQLKYVDIQFKTESKLNDNLLVKLGEKNDSFIHQIINQKTQKECIRMLSKF